VIVDDITGMDDEMGLLGKIVYHLYKALGALKGIVAMNGEIS
jgi:hypothetical protein